jgi:23S rRNA G2445 N2-methylase RlmL
LDLKQESPILVTCSPGLAPFLSDEVKKLGLPIKLETEIGIHTMGDFKDCIRLNLASRMAYSVMFLLDELTCSTADELYKRASTLPWEHLISPDEYLSITSTVDNPTIKNWTFANLKLKDAIVDRILRKCGKRPNSGSERDNVVIHLYWKDENVRLYLNTSGEKLADRGYRKIPMSAPMRENLAAGVVLATGYDGTRPFINPMCGSGTLAIEAALIALGRPPSFLRSNFGFMHVLGYDAETYKALKKEASAGQKKLLAAPIIATDNDPDAVNAARRNAATAGVQHLIEFSVCDFADTPMPEGGGIIVLNPEYGERMGEMNKLAATYARIGDWFKQKCAGSTGYIFTGNPALGKKVGLRTSRKIPFWNAKIECRLLEYRMYEGTMKHKKEQEGTVQIPD